MIWRKLQKDTCRIAVLNTVTSLGIKVWYFVLHAGVEMWVGISVSSVRHAVACEEPLCGSRRDLVEGLKNVGL